MDVLQAQRQRLAKALQNDKKGIFSKIYKSYDRRFFDSFGGLDTLVGFLGLNTKNKITLILQNLFSNLLMTNKSYFTVSYSLKKKTLTVRHFPS